MARQECDYYAGREIELLGSSTTLEGSVSITPAVYNKYDFLLFKVNVKSSGTELYRSNQILVPTIELSLASDMPDSCFAVNASDSNPVGSSNNLNVFIILNKNTCLGYWWAQFSNATSLSSLSYVMRVYGIKQ